MTQRNEYALDEKIKLIEKYRKQAYMSTGSTSARKWYLRGIKYAKKGGKYDQKNYEYFYDFQEHDAGYEKKGFAFFEKAANCFEKPNTFVLGLIGLSDTCLNDTRQNHCVSYYYVIGTFSFYRLKTRNFCHFVIRILVVFCSFLYALESSKNA